MSFTASETFFWTIAAGVFVFGTLIGSFLNVVIYRVPANLSIVRPRSRCGACGTTIRWYDNVPIVSWLVLRGKCRDCGERIAARYPFVELLTGLLALALWHQLAGGLMRLEQLPEMVDLGPTFVLFALRFVFLALLVAITFVDLDHVIIPHEFTLPGIVVGLASPWIVEAMFGPLQVLKLWPPVTPFSSLVGAIAGFLSVFVIFYVYLAARGVEGIGGGDATLMALVGAWLGWPSLVFVFFAASVQGLVAAGIAYVVNPSFILDSADIFEEDDAEKHGAAPEEAVENEGLDRRDGGEPAEREEDEGAMRGKAAVPFGPFIALAAAEYLLLGPYLPDELSLRYLFY